MGKTALATNIAYNIAEAHFRSERQADGTMKAVDGGIVGFFSWKCRPSSSPRAFLPEQTGLCVREDPPRQDRQDEFERRDYTIKLSICRSISTRRQHHDSHSPPARGG